MMAPPSNLAQGTGTGPPLLNLDDSRSRDVLDDLPHIGDLPTADEHAIAPHIGVMTDDEARRFFRRSGCGDVQRLLGHSP
jgi:hypothetical protein